jgi:hypothetical protein
VDNESNKGDIGDTNNVIKVNFRTWRRIPSKEERRKDKEATKFIVESIINCLQEQKRKP